MGIEAQNGKRITLFQNKFGKKIVISLRKLV